MARTASRPSKARKSRTRRGVTILDVANKAGVCLATASRAFGHTQVTYIAPETKERGVGSLAMRLVWLRKTGCGVMGGGSGEEDARHFILFGRDANLLPRRAPGTTLRRTALSKDSS